MRPTASLDTRLYRAALHPYPPVFRRDFSGKIVRVFDEARQEMILTRPEDGLWTFRARMIVDLARTIVGQWLRTGWPCIAVLSILLGWVGLFLIGLIGAAYRVHDRLTGRHDSQRSSRANSFLIES
jgi:hypothetical protein